MRPKQRCSILHAIAYMGLEFSFPMRETETGVAFRHPWTIVRVKVNEYADKGCDFMASSYRLWGAKIQRFFVLHNSKISQAIS